MAIKNAVYKVDNGTDFDEIHFKTKAAQVFKDDGKTLQDFFNSGGTVNGSVNFSGSLLVGNNNIVAYGSNSNGEYIRFYNGIQICVKTVALSNIGCTRQWGTMYETGQLGLGTWPASFLQIPKVNITLRDSQAGFVEMVNETTATVAGHCTVARPVWGEQLIFKFDIISIGRWK